MEVNLPFLLCFGFNGNFPSTSPQGAYIWRDDLAEGFLRYPIGGLIFGGAYTWLIFGILRYKVNHRAPTQFVCVTDVIL